MHQGYITENIPEIANTFRGLAQFDYKKKQKIRFPLNSIADMNYKNVIMMIYIIGI